MTRRAGDKGERRAGRGGARAASWLAVFFVAFFAMARAADAPAEAAPAANVSPAAPAPNVSPASPPRRARPLVFGTIVGGQGRLTGPEAVSLAYKFDSEALSALGKAMGAEIRLRPIAWDAARDALANGEIDAIGGLAMVGDLPRRFRFVLPHRQVRAVFLTLAEREPVAALRDVFGLRVAVAQHSAVAAMLRDSGWLDKFQVTYCAGATDALDAVMEQRVDVACLSQAQALTLRREYNFYGRQLKMSEPLLSAPYGCAVRLGDAALAERLDRGWLRLRLNGTLERLNRKWLGEDVPRPPLRVAVPQTACGVNDRVLAEMAQRLDLRAEVVPVPLPETLRPALEPERGFDATVVVNELADVIDPEWKRRAPPGHPTGVMARIVAFAPADGLNLDDLSALRGARVGINRQFACLEPVVEARVGGPVDWVRMADDVDMARMLQANQVAAYVVPEEFSRMHATKGLRRVELFDFAEKVVFQRHQQALAAACGEALADMRNDGTLDAILAGSNPHPDGKKRVMFVHSFGGDFSPFYETGRHIVRELSRQQALVEHAYLENASHGAYAAERDQLLASHLRRTHGGTYYDLVIAEDFPALDFVHRHHEQLFYRVPVYAYGVGGSLRAVLEEAPEATGMVEEISAGETFALIRHLHPEMKRLYVVNDHSPSGLALREAIASQIAPLARAAGCVVEHSPNVSLSELLARTRSLDQRTVAFFGTYTTDATTGQTADREAFRGLMERVPTYGVFDRYQRVGQIGGKLVAPAAPGDACMAAINRLLSGAPPTSVPIFDSSADNRWLFSQESLRRHGVTGDLPAGATVTVAEAEPTPGWGLGTPQALALAFALLLTLVVILLWLVARARAAEAENAPRSGGRPARDAWRVLGLAALLTLPLVLFYQVAAAQVMARMRENLADSAGRVAEALAASQRETQARLRGVANAILASGTDVDDAEKTARLRAFANRVGAVEAAWLWPSGDGCATGGPLLDLSAEDFVQAARGGRAAWSSLRHHALSRGLDPAGGVVVTAVPVGEDDNASGARAVALLAQGCQALEGVMRAGLRRSEVRVILLDGSGQAVVGGYNASPKARDAAATAAMLRGPDGEVQNLAAAFVGKTGVERLYVDGEWHVCGYCKVTPDSDWVAVVTAPSRALGNQLLPLLVLGGALALVVLVTLAVVLWRAQRAQALTQAANLALRRDRDDMAARNALLERETRDLAREAAAERDASRGHGLRLEELRRRLLGLLDDGSGVPATPWGGHADIDGVCAALAERLAWYRSLIDNTVVPMVVLDERKNLLFGNAAWRQMDGQVPMEMFARAYDAFPADGGYALPAGEGPAAALAGGEEGGDPRSLCFHDAAHGRWLQMRVAWIVNAAGERRGCIVSAEDVTLAHEQEAHLRLLVDNLPIGCVFHDLRTMEVNYANPALLRMLAVATPAEYGLRWREYFAPVQPGGQGALDVHLALLTQLKRDGKAAGDLVCRNSRGEDVPCRVTGVVCGERAIFFIFDRRGGLPGATGEGGAPGARPGE